MVKAKGFSTFESLTAFVEQAVKANPKLKKVDLVLSPKVICANVRSNAHLLAEGPRIQFLEKLRAYVEAVENLRSNQDLRASNPLSVTDTLMMIQDHCLFLANLRLASETFPKTMSLDQWANSTVDYPTRVLSVKDLGALIKLVRKSESQVDLLEGGDANVAFNCFHCPNFAVTKDVLSSASVAATVDSHAHPVPRLKFVDRVMSNFNVYRAIPHDDLESILSHMNSVHSISEDPAVGKQIGSHRFLLMCRICAVSKVSENCSNLFVCCLEHLQNHILLLHSKDLILMGLFKVLRDEFKDDTALLTTISHFLLAQCNLCGRLTGSITERDTHQSTCLKRFITLSLHYGETLSTELFQSSHTKQRRKQLEHDHAFQQIRKLAQSVMTEIRERAPVSVAVVDSNADLFEKVIDRETEMDFAVDPKSSSTIAEDERPSTSQQPTSILDERRVFLDKLEEALKEAPSSLKKKVTKYFRCSSGFRRGGKF